MPVKKRSTKTGLPHGALIHIGEKKAELVKINILDHDEIQFEEGKELLLERAKEVDSLILVNTAKLPVLPEHKQPKPLD